MKNKRLLKVLPLVLASSVITACGTNLKVNNGDNKVFESTKETVTDVTLQDLYEDLYEDYGVDVASSEIIYQLCLQVFKDSGRSQQEWNERIEEFFQKQFLTSTYMLDGEFHEELLVAALRSQGYNIKDNGNYFVGTAKDFPTYHNLYSALKCDYSDFINRYVNPYVAKLFLNEEYILQQKQVYFGSKEIRYVQYFKCTPSSFSTGDNYATIFEKTVLDNKDKSFKDIVLGEGGIDEIWREELKDEETQKFATIDYTKSTKYANKYQNVFASDASSDLLSTLKSYSSDGKQSILTGYDINLKTIDNTYYFYEGVYTNEGNQVIGDTIDNMIFKTANKIKLDSNGYLLLQEGSNAICHSYNGSYYIVNVKVINNNSSAEDKKLGAKALAESSANIKGAIRYFLEKYNVGLYEQDLHDYFNENYSYNAENK